MSEEKKDYAPVVMSMAALAIPPPEEKNSFSFSHSVFCVRWSD